jgi:1-deoxy-D-xylulose-5-phosphate reductoisomerase
LKNIILIGSTGSIGTQTADVVKEHSNLFKISGLGAGKNIELLKQQVIELKPELISVELEEDKEKIEAWLEEKGFNSKVYSGMDGILKLVSQGEEGDIFLNAIVGARGIIPTLEAIKKKMRIAIANKETLVAGGPVVLKAAKKSGSELIPVDSEHSAIFQCLQGSKEKEVKELILTCSGGPFRTFTKEQMASVTVEQALKHPTWNMGKMITLDSATLVNKSRELIEAVRLFNVKPEQVKITIHPQSIVHSGVKFKDESVLLQVGPHDMRIPIQYALSYPNRIEKISLIQDFDLIKVKQLDFFEPDFERFQALPLAYKALEMDGTATAVFNAAAETATQSFIDLKIKFLQMPELIKAALEAHKTIKNPSLDQILEADKWARIFVENKIGDLK